jgi:hypothetical protein
MWSTQKNHPGQNEPWKQRVAPVPPNKLAEPRSGRVFDEEETGFSQGRTRDERNVCVLCAASTHDMICGACADKIRAEAAEHKRWEEKGGH